jgi:hypothetical protein
MTALQKCRIDRLFDNSRGVLNFVLYGRMTRSTCSDLQKGEGRYAKMIEREALYQFRQDNPIFRSQYKTFVKGCDLAHINPSVYQAVKWLQKAGAAYKTWQRDQFKNIHKPRARK